MIIDNFFTAKFEETDVVESSLLNYALTTVSHKYDLKRRSSSSSTSKFSFRGKFGVSRETFSQHLTPRIPPRRV